MSNATQIAQTIKQQIGINTLMCIAAHQLQVIPESNQYLGGLAFKIGRNPKMKQGGYCTITLDFNDTYSVKIVSARGKTLLHTSNIYCDQLGGQNGIIEGVTG